MICGDPSQNTIATDSPALGRTQNRIESVPYVFHRSLARKENDSSDLATYFTSQAHGLPFRFLNVRMNRNGIFARTPYLKPISVGNAKTSSIKPSKPTASVSSSQTRMMLT